MTLEFFCEEHGLFEELFLREYVRSYPCKTCGKEAEQIWANFPNVDSAAFAAWNNYHDDRVGTFTDKKKYRQAVDAAGYRIKEPGSDKEAEAKGKAWEEMREKQLKDRIGKFFQERTLDQIRDAIKVDATIYDAQQKGDENKLKAMGAPTSLDECYKRANTE